MARLPLLDRLVIDEPCAQDWDAMPGDRTRFCGSCKRSVTDLSAVEAEEAEAFLSRHRGKSLCVRLAVVALAAGCSTRAPTAVPPPPEPAPAAAPAPVASISETAPEAPSEASPEPVAPTLSTTEAAPEPAPPPPKQKQSRVTMGCVCVPADPLCSCL